MIKCYRLRSCRLFATWCHFHNKDEDRTRVSYCNQINIHLGGTTTKCYLVRSDITASTQENVFNGLLFQLHNVLGILHKKFFFLDALTKTPSVPPISTPTGIGPVAPTKATKPSIAAWSRDQLDEWIMENKIQFLVEK